MHRCCVPCAFACLVGRYPGGMRELGTVARMHVGSSHVPITNPLSLVSESSSEPAYYIAGIENELLCDVGAQ